MTNPLVRFEQCSIGFKLRGKTTHIIKDCTFQIDEGSIFGLVGESGSGKTTLGLSLLGLLSQPLKILDGGIYYRDHDISLLNAQELRKIRGSEIGMVFQEPLYAFNPVFTLGDQIDESLKIHTSLNKHQRQERLHELIDMVGLDNPRRILRSYPHQLSGGMRQRVMIAHALSGNPQLLIADEPTSNLDVTLQANIIELFKKLNKELKLTLMLITHDIGMVRHMCNQTVVLYKGSVVEQGQTQSLIESPNEPYTKKLVQASLL